MLKVVHGFVDSKRMICFCMACAMLSVALISFGAHATNPQSVDYNVYIKPSLNVSVSSNSVVLNINPAGSLNGSNNPNNFASNNLNVSVATNNQYGYRLYMNSNTSNLVKTDDNTEIIPTLDTTTTESNFPYNKWGYKFSTDTNYQPFQANTNIPISSSDTATNEISTTLNFGAKANYDKKAGQYELDLNFKALPTVTTYYMQDIAKDSTLAESVCTEEPTVVIDKRDEKAYTIRRIGGDGTSANPGDCWMVENLQFTGTELDSTTSNVAPNYTPTNPYRVNNGNGYYDLDGTEGSDPNGHCYGVNTGSGGGYTNSCMHKGSNGYSGGDTVWYNYAAASAETITGSANTDAQLYDICPSGWRLPNRIEMDNITDYTSRFNPVLGGEYATGIPQYESQDGYWWNSIVNNNSSRDFLVYYDDLIHANNSDFGKRYKGFYIRCILNGVTSGKTINDINTMQDFYALSETERTQVINSMYVNQPYIKKDARDNELYHIAKMDDGKVWMLDNLNLDLSNSTILNNLDNTNTNATNEALGHLRTGGGTTSNQWPTAGLANWTTQINAYDVPLMNKAGTCNTTATESCMYSGTYNSNTPLSSVTTGAYGLGYNKIGIYYNFCAASAGSYCWGNGADSGTHTESSGFNVNSDICPAGWRLPIGGPTGEFIGLCNAINGSPCSATGTTEMDASSTDSLQYKFSGSLTGYYYLASSGATAGGMSQGRYGLWHAATYSTSAHFYNANTTPTSVHVTHHSGRAYGQSIRCLVK